MKIDRDLERKRGGERLDRGHRFRPKLEIALPLTIVRFRYNVTCYGGAAGDGWRRAASEGFPTV